MLRPHKNAYRRIATVALVGLILRSLVAPGLMLVDGSDGFGGLSLVLCPGQNLGLNFDLLAGGEVHHKHHHVVVSQDPSQLHPDRDQNPGLHAESIDTGCALWVASASGAPLAAYKLSFSGLAQTAHSIPRTVVRVRSALQRNNQPRAPPIIT